MSEHPEALETEETAIEAPEAETPEPEAEENELSEDTNSEDTNSDQDPDLAESETDSEAEFAEVTDAEKKEAAEAIAELQRMLRGPQDQLSEMPAEKVAYPVGLDPALVEGVDMNARGDER